MVVAVCRKDLQRPEGLNAPRMLGFKLLESPLVGDSGC